MQTRSAIYARISLDRKDGAGVARQLADCRELAAQRGWDVTEEFVDNNVSAIRANRRPEWDRLVEGLDQFDALIAYHSDRLYRRTRDLEDLIDAVEGQGVEIATVKAGDLDLSTATGRWMARQLGANARLESERIGERVARAKADRAAQGLPPGGGFRAFGWEADKMTLHPAESAAIRQAAERVAAGGSMGEEVRRLNEDGFLTTGDRPWTVASLRRVLTSPRIAGKREYAGRIIGDAAWPAIVDVATWEVICAIVRGRRRGRPPSDRYLLTALIECPQCGRPLYGNTNQYGCVPGSRGGCGGASISIAAADGRVVREVDGYLNDPQVPMWLSEGARGTDLSSEVRALEEKQVELARRWAMDQITLAAYDEARKTLERRLRELGDVKRPDLRVPSLKRVRAAWAAGSTAEKRGVVRALIDCPIGLTPGRMADPGDRLVIEFN